MHRHRDGQICFKGKGKGWEGPLVFSDLNFLPVSLNTEHTWRGILHNQCQSKGNTGWLGQGQVCQVCSYFWLMDDLFKVCNLCDNIHKVPASGGADSAFCACVRCCVLHMWCCCPACTHVLAQLVFLHSLPAYLPLSLVYCVPLPVLQWVNL